MAQKGLPGMPTFDVSLPEELKPLIEAEAAAGGYENPSAYVQHVVREALRAQRMAELEARLVAAAESGPPIEVTPEFWDQMKARVRQRRDQRRLGAVPGDPAPPGGQGESGS